MDSHGKKKPTELFKVRGGKVAEENQEMEGIF